MRRGVSERERGAPGAAKEHHALEPKTVAQRLDVLDQMPGGVLLGAAERDRAPAAALVGEDDAIELRIEEPPMQRLRMAPRTAVEKDRRKATRIAALLEMNGMPATHR